MQIHNAQDEMTVVDRNSIISLIFLELISFSPLIIIMGNVIPPFPIKIHFIAFGLVFLCSLWILASRSSKKWVLYFALFYIVIQFTVDFWDIKSFVDFFFGPFTLIVLVDLIVNKRFPLKIFKRYVRRFYYLLWVPISIAILQFFDLLPLTFWNATYINSALIDGVYIPRPNGFLYHGSELSIILCFVALFQYFKPEQKSFWMLILLIFVCLMTYFKAILACVIVLFLYYMLYVNRGALSRFRLVSKSRVLWYGGLLLLIGVFFALRWFSIVHEYTGYYFPSQMLTGRGSIWNIYLDGIKEFNAWNYLFGSGMGSAFEIFKENATAENFYPLQISKKLYTVHHPHNALLSIFINSGIIGLLFIFFIFRIIFNQIKGWKPNAKTNKKIYFAVFIIPLLTIGITIIIYEMAIIWPCIGFLFYRWYISTHENESATQGIS